MTKKGIHIPQQCIVRLQKEYLQIQKEEIPNIVCAPIESNLLEWHYVIHNLTEEQSPNFFGGTYHGKLIFSPQYPFKPPSIYMLTPNGRFQINQRICTSMSDFHPESWRPLWSIRSILIGLLSFFLDEKEPQTYGSVQTTSDEKRKYARNSMQYNSKDEIFCELFPQLIKQYKDQVKKEKKIEKKRTVSAAAQLMSTAQKQIQTSQSNPYVNYAVFIFVALFILYLAL